MNKKNISFITIIIVVFLSNISNAANSTLPRFATIKFNKVNARTGPELDCPIEWVFIKKSEPVEIIAEYGNWRKIKDITGQGGWVRSTALSRKRAVVISSSKSVNLFESPKKYEQVVAILKPKLRCSLEKCKDSWCKINCKSYKGWVAEKHLWGVLPGENA